MYRKQRARTLIGLEHLALIGSTYGMQPKHRKNIMSWLLTRRFAYVLQPANEEIQREVYFISYWFISFVLGNTQIKENCYLTTVHY